MKTCCECEKTTKIGYHRDPSNGRVSQSFWCDDCFERGMQRSQQLIVHNESAVASFIHRASRISTQRAEY